MIILDTNVLSELMRPEPDLRVIKWLEVQTPRTLYVTTLSYAEMLFGAALMASGKRQAEIRERISIMFLSRFHNRVLAFGANEAPAYAQIVSDRQRTGRRMEPMDGLIAAIARTRDAAIATRDRDFSGCSVTVINPWAIS